jgi:uncharacterized membrane protein YfcA
VSGDALDLRGWAIALAVGLFTGVISGLMGIGGGNVLVPASTILLGLEQHQAQGVSLLVIVPTALAGAWGHYRHGNVHLRAAALLSAGAVAGGLAGARLAQTLPGDFLRICFGIILLYFAIRYLGLIEWLQAKRARRPPPEQVRLTPMGPAKPKEPHPR